MRYGSEHKDKTRRRILAAASESFRERGLAESGIDEIMRRAGLTHGGFYAHFHGKDELVAEACISVFEDAVENLQRIATRRTRDERLRLFIDSYLSARHRDNRSSGCLVAAVGADIARLSGPARAGYERGFSGHLERLARALGLADNPVAALRLATELLGALVGTLLVARALGGTDASDSLLHSMRRRLRTQFGLETISGVRAHSVLPAVPTNDFLLAHAGFLS